MTLNAGCGNDFWGNVRIDTNPNARAKTHTMDVRNIAFPDKYFDKTRCISVLEHVPDWKKAIKELCRVSKKILIEVPVNSNLLKTDILRILIPTKKNIKLWKSRKKRAEQTYHQFDPQDIKLELEKHGFKVKYVMIYQFYHHYLSRCWRFRAKIRK